MALQKYVPTGDAPSVSVKPLSFSSKEHEKSQLADFETISTVEPDVNIDLREIFFLIMHFLSAGPCHRTYGQFWNELLEHQLLPRRYHAWYSRNGVHSGDENDDGMSLPLSYNKLVERYPHIEMDHLVKLLKQLILNTASPSRGISGGNAPNAADVPTLLGTGSFSLLDYDRSKGYSRVKAPPVYMRWPHMQADQVRGLTLREIGGGFSRHHRGPSIRGASYAIAKPSTMVQKMQNIKRLRGHRNAVYCAVFDRLGRYVITGSDDRLVKIWSMETAYCLASCRGHEGDITDLAVSSNNVLVASSSNDCIIRVWRLADGLPISVLRGHTGAVTAIAFSPRPGSVYQLLSSSDDGTCRIWDATKSQVSPRVYVPRPSDSAAVPGRNNAPSSSTGPQTCQIFCCAFNANGTVFVTGSSDNLARVWPACKSNTDDSEQPNHELDVLSGHENDVNYVQFSGCAVGSKFCMADTSKEENLPKFKNSWFTQENIVTCSRDGSAIIWLPRSRRSHGKVGRWTRAYHLKVPPPPMPPQPPRGGPRQRILPTPRGVNMVTWSLDNRFVLAAIMDCRICVWNAADGSLVHSLTGHSESTYVLDVHPFNPRIAMSAGYDGKTIVWDIWEGTPIRVYEIAPFKLVDGKFSPDGTSIILSDDVGQLYILNTGQGESQMDAKYDQFFLGDYRPLIQDTHGNVLDQETQLPPYIRNIQDLLCDSGMLPYPEPYQSMYQQRRLGALGIEWRPSSLRLTVGTDITLDQEYQMLPLVDLDILADPLQEFTHTMDWEPEIEVQSDDADSEYNVTDEYSSGGEQPSLSSNSSGDPECSDEDSDVENTHKDVLRRSKRKKPKVETEIMTSSGRRVKRRNLDECNGNSFRNHRTKKSSGRKVRRRKSSILKPLRPQRAAARNALTLFSRITGTSTDGEEEDGLEDELSGSESMLQDTIIETDESDESLQNKQSKNVKGKEVSLDEPEEVVEPYECPEVHTSDRNRRRLVLKFPLRDSNKLVPSEIPINKCDNREDLVGSSSKVVGEASEVNCSGVVQEDRILSEKAGNHLDLSEGYKDGEIRWGGVKARTSKRMRLGDAMPSDAGSSRCVNHHDQSENYVNGCIKPETEHVIISPRGLSGAADGKENSGLNECGDYDELPKLGHMVIEDTAASSIQFNNGAEHSPELNGACTPISRKSRIRSKTISKDPENPSKLKIKFLGEGWRNGSCETLSESPSDIDQNLISEGRQWDDANRTSSDHVDDGLQNVDAQMDNNTDSVLKNSQELHSYSRKKMYDAVYKRSRTHRLKINSEADTGGMEESTSNACDINMNAELDVSESTINGSRRTRSMGLKSTTDCSNSRDRCQQIPLEEWSRSSSRVVVGLRSTRNRRGNYNLADTSAIDRRRSHQSAKKQSWLMLSTHEGSRYIPQLGDEVAYLRQGHQEYIEFSHSKEIGPWVKYKLRDVEFCKVIGLAYDYVPGSGESCCKMTIKFVDPISSVLGNTFKLTLPEVISFPDFLVEKSRFDAAIQRNWTSRDKCQVWWKNEDEEDGAWWEGRILSVKPKSADFPDSPWERYVIQYKSDPTTHCHSPWELHNADSQWEQPHIDDVIREKLLSFFAKLDQSGNKVQDQYGVNKLKQVSDKTNFRNRSPVPLSLEVIHLRVENNYYRSLEALKHDIAVMLSVADSYFEKNAELSPKIRRLAEWFTRTLSSL